MARACRHWGVSRQAYYQQLQHQRQRCARADTVLELVREVRLRQPRLGARKLHHLLKQPLQQAGAGLGRDALLDVLREARMLVAPRRAYHKTTGSHHRFRRHPNLLKEGPHQVRATASEQVWVADKSVQIYNQERPHLSLELKTPDEVHRASIAGFNTPATCPS